MNDTPLVGFFVELSVFAALFFAIALSSGDKATRLFALLVVCGGTAIVALLIAVLQ